MNFVLIMNDTLRPDYLSAYGNTWVRTPHAARFAETAAVFDQAYVGSFPTIPNRTDLLTGRFGEPFHAWLPLPYDAVTLPDILRENGYVTQLICDTPHLINGGGNFDWPFSAWDFIRGQEIDRYGMSSDPVVLPFQDMSKSGPQFINTSISQYLRNIQDRQIEEDWATHQTCQRVVNWLERNAKHEKFFLWVDAFDPHEPNLPPQHYTDLYDPGYEGDVLLSHVPDPARLTEAEIKNVIARYAGTVTFVDRCFGRIMETLDVLGLSDNTCVIWLSDHGTYLNEHGIILTKTPVYDPVCRTVLMIRMPGGASAGKRFDDLVQPADLAPTLLDMAGIQAPERMQGASFLPLLQGEPCPVRDVAISAKVLNLKSPDHTITARDGRWLLVDRPDPAARELYDSQTDPGQLSNVAQDHPEEVERLHEGVLKFLKTHEAQEQVVRLYETGDPGDMTGYVPQPPRNVIYRFYSKHILNSRLVEEPE
ncbi:MAG: sulfatase-like hydrolase/transferase [Planctomycetes bacterium]|nr:sulfatase-like hydrolase/transferase [Planctomycetota bacterium]